MENLLADIQKKDIKTHEILTCQEDVIYIYIVKYCTVMNGERIETNDGLFTQEDDAKTYMINRLHWIGESRNVTDYLLTSDREQVEFWVNPCNNIICHHIMTVNKVPVHRHL